MFEIDYVKVLGVRWNFLKKSNAFYGLRNKFLTIRNSKCLEKVAAVISRRFNYYMFIPVVDEGKYIRVLEVKCVVG